MLASHVKLSSKGQIVIPKTIRDSLHWDTGVELTLVASESGVFRNYYLPFAR
jgi:AbrB family looped-hinge helix DNA binding protein